MNTGAGLRVELMAEQFGLVVLCSDPNLKTNDELFASGWGVGLSAVAAAA